MWSRPGQAAGSRWNAGKEDTSPPSFPLLSPPPYGSIHPRSVMGAGSRTGSSAARLGRCRCIKLPPRRLAAGPVSLVLGQSGLASPPPPHPHFLAATRRVRTGREQRAVGCKPSSTSHPYPELLACLSVSMLDMKFRCVRSQLRFHRTDAWPPGESATWFAGSTALVMDGLLPLSLLYPSPLPNCRFPFRTNLSSSPFPPPGPMTRRHRQLPKWQPPAHE